MTSLDTSAPVGRLPTTDAAPVVSFSLDPAEATASGLHRILLEQVDLAAWHLDRAQRSDTHVHEVRKGTKRVRAVLRMARGGIGSGDYTRLNMEVRDLARELSQLRSAVVQVELLEFLVADNGQFSADTAALHTELEVVAEAQRDALEDSVVHGLSQRFGAVRAEIDSLSIPTENDVPLDGVRLTYRRGRRSMAYAYGDPTVSNFHVWRKQVKYLRHQMELLQSGGSPAVATLVSDLEEIGEGLGMDHDLADLERAAQGASPSTLTPSGRGHLKAVISERRADLELSLRPIAARVYSTRASVFAQQVTPPGT